MPGKSGSNRVNRGGSWNNDAANLRAANRNNNTPDNRNNNLGFRLSNTGESASLPVRYGGWHRAVSRPARSPASGYAGSNTASPLASGRPLTGFDGREGLFVPLAQDDGPAQDAAGDGPRALFSFVQYRAFLYPHRAGAGHLRGADGVCPVQKRSSAANTFCLHSYEKAQVWTIENTSASNPASAAASPASGACASRSMTCWAVWLRA
ncbi:MAG: SUMF1/EgtB/PvdO family nonheme iron enzyme [Bacteroidia bacterium]|nr:SUMF1/EgtB/PvdO family nonheme iron enzyme [Bacteroidia bacterium]